MHEHGDHMPLSVPLRVEAHLYSCQCGDFPNSGVVWCGVV